MPTTTLRIDREAFVRRGLGTYGREIRERAQDVSDAWDDVIEIIFTHEEDVFSAEGATDEHGRWAPLSDDYLAWKERVAPGQPILVLTEKLCEQLTGQSDDHYERREPTRLTIGSDYPTPEGDLGGLHAEGRDDPLMPPRPPFRITGNVAGDIGMAIMDHVLDAPEE